MTAVGVVCYDPAKLRLSRRQASSSRECLQERFHDSSTKEPSMRASHDRILTTHVGALPMPPNLWGPSGADDQQVREAVRQVVQFQRSAGVDIVNEGELTKGGNWVSFVNDR